MKKGGPLDKLAEGGAALASGVETFSAGTLPKLGEVAEETARAMRQMRRTVSAVDDNPQSLIFGNGPPVPGPGEPGFSAQGDRKNDLLQIPIHCRFFEACTVRLLSIQ
jgi:phospholipid/cholesterol/gamma-HCH transport system substrate-binding protein